MAVSLDPLVEALRGTHGLHVHQIRPVPEGVTTRNVTAVDPARGRVFVKVYSADTDLDAEEKAIGLNEFAAAGGVPSAPLIPTSTGHRIATHDRMPYSVWRHVNAPSGQRNGLTLAQMRDVGHVLGRMHRRLGQHPLSTANPNATAALPELDRAETVLTGLLAQQDYSGSDPLRRWAHRALRERLDVLSRLRTVLADDPGYAAQVTHGDLAAPNILVSGDRVAAIVDYQPPRLGAIAHDLSRIGCDPRTVLRLGRRWPTALADLTRAYRAGNPAASATDLAGCVRWWVYYTAASTYPLRQLLTDDTATDPSLARYARQRHRALLLVLAQLDDVGAALTRALQQ